MPVAARSLGDKSELPLLTISPLPASSSDSTDAVDTDTQNGAIESQLSDLAIGLVAGTDGHGEVNSASHDMVGTGQECGNVNHSESVADTDAAVELAAEDGAAAVAHSTCDAEAELLTCGDAVGSDTKGEMNQLFRHFSPVLILLSTLMSLFCFPLIFPPPATTTTIVLWPFVRDYPGEPVPEETLTHPPS